MQGQNFWETDYDNNSNDKLSVTALPSVSNIAAQEISKYFTWKIYFDLKTWEIAMVRFRNDI